MRVSSVCDQRLLLALRFTTFSLIVLSSTYAPAVEIIEGFSQPNRIAKVSAGTSGIISELEVSEGAVVTAGDCLLRIDDTVHTQLLKVSKATKEARGEIAAAKAQLKTIQDRVNAIRGLASRDHATGEELMRVMGEQQLAEANLLTAQEKQKLREAEYQKLLAESQKYCVRAPFDGVVVDFLKQKGEFVGPVDPNVCTVAELSTLSVDFLVAREYRKQLSVNAPVTVLFVEPGQRVTGTIYYISPYPDGETNTYSVKVRIDNAAGQLTAGERCELQLGT